MQQDNRWHERVNIQAILDDGTDSGCSLIRQKHSCFMFTSIKCMNYFLQHDDENEIPKGVQIDTQCTVSGFSITTLFTVPMPLHKCQIFLFSNVKLCLGQTAVKTFSDAHLYTPQFPVSTQKTNSICTMFLMERMVKNPQKGKNNIMFPVPIDSHSLVSLQSWIIIL